jgi:hypothetical protein
MAIKSARLRCKEVKRRDENQIYHQHQGRRRTIFEGNNTSPAHEADDLGGAIVNARRDERPSLRVRLVT